MSTLMKFTEIAAIINAQADSFYNFIKTFVLDEESWHVLNSIAKQDQVYVLSGVIRDFLTGDYEGARDFDCVLLQGGIKDKEIVTYLRSSKHSVNSFGGIKIRRPSEVIDVWQLKNTWGIKKRNLNPDVQSLINSVFFNFSAIVYDFNAKKFVYDDKFCTFLATKTMDVVFAENPNIPLCLINVLHYHRKYGYNVSLKLANWIKCHYNENFDFESTQKKHFGQILYYRESINDFIQDIIDKTPMYKIDWGKYLSSGRYRSNSEFESRKEKEEEKRNSFESDFGRITFSSALRRMHDKAQVVPLTSGDSIHTRLTHSIEVMNIAYSLGTSLCRDDEFIKLYTKEQAFEYERQIPMILKTAAFVHDIGNPPFGHFGEKIIQNYFDSYLKKRIITDQQALDFTCFDGNAEGFRILTRLQYIGDLSGLNLTYATLATYCKYPNIGNINKGYIGTKKHGVFTSESDIFEKMVEACNMKLSNGKVKRHPLSFLVEAADSIAYNVMDIEDGHAMKWYSFKEVTDYLNQKMQKLTGDRNYSIHKVLGLYSEEKQAHESDEKRKICDFRVKAIRYFVNLALKNFKNHLEEIDKGEYNKELIEDNDCLSIAMQDFAKEYIFPQRQIEQIELTGYSVINGLLDILLKCAFSDDKKFRNHLKSVLSNTILKVAMREQDLKYSTEYKYLSNEDLHNFDVEDLNSYSKLRMIVDLISGMTDKYAVSMYQKLSGQKL